MTTFPVFIVPKLCHLRAHNDGPVFYRLPKRLTPDWEKRRERLNNCAMEGTSR